MDIAVLYGAVRALAPSDAAQQGLLEYGVLGISLLFTASAVVVLFKHAAATHDRERTHLLDELDKASKRAERGEDELRKLNDAFRERYVVVLGEATRAVTDALETVRQARRGRDRD